MPKLRQTYNGHSFVEQMRKPLAFHEESQSRAEWITSLGGKHINLLEEADRNSEPLTTAKKRRSIQEKFDHYHQFFRRDPHTRERG